jgi:hypothetical protein
MIQQQKHDDQTTSANKHFKNLEEQKAYSNILAEAAWSLAYSSLWNTSLFSERETEAATNFINHYIYTAPDPYKGYIILCERVLLARMYVARNGSRYIPLPSTWFNVTNVKGFAGTDKWYQNLLLVRSSLPVYKIELKAFAEAILEMAEEPSVNNFSYWRNYFIERNKDLLELFLATTANVVVGREKMRVGR